MVFVDGEKAELYAEGEASDGGEQLPLLEEGSMMVIGMEASPMVRGQEDFG